MSTLEGFLLIIAGTFLFIIVLNVNNMTYLRNKISDLEESNKDLKNKNEKHYWVEEAQAVSEETWKHIKKDGK